MKRLFPPFLASLAVVWAMAGPARSAIHASFHTSFGDGARHFGQAGQKLSQRPTPDEDARRGGGVRKTDIIRGQSHEKAARAAYELGVRYGRGGRYAEAVGAFREAVLYNPEHSDAHFGLGHALYDLGRWGEAAEAFRRATELNRRDFEAFNYLGAAYFKQGLYEKAIAAYKEVLVQNPVVTDAKYVDVRYNVANAFYKAGRYEPAIRYYTDITFSRPKSAELFNDLGVAYAEWGRFKEATEAFTRATKLNPDDAHAQSNLALSYYVQGQHQEAVKAFERAARLAPSDAAIRRNAGIVSAASSPGQVTAVGDRVSLLAKTGAVGWRQGVSWLGDSHVIHGIDAEDSPAGTGPEAGAGLNPEPPAKSNSAVRPAPPASGAGATAAPRSTPTPISASPDSARPVVTPGADTAVKGNEVAAHKGEPPASPAPPPPPVVKPTDIYLVGVGDVLDIRLLEGMSNTSTLYVVLAGGLVEYPPLKDPFPAAGKTVEEIAAHIKSELKRLAVQDDARVVVGVREYASHAVIVSGLVAEPGAKVLRREAVPLYVIMADAQPLPEAGRALVTSYVTGQKVELSLENQEELNTLVRPGDVINVLAKRQEFYYVGGKVASPGEKGFHRGITLTQAILASGGLLHSGKSAVVTRQNAEGLLSTTRHDLKEIVSGKVPDPLLQPGDRIEVIR
jgi:Flp pilus assembly protein TadD/protein involved in polysaccharide export with SLBB domain